MNSEENNYFENVTFEELKIGQKASITHTLTRKDIDLFAAMSGSVNAGKMDQSLAGSSAFCDLLGHVICSGPLLSSLLGTVLPGPGTVLLKQDFSFKKPVWLGDNIFVSTTVSDKHKDRPVAVFDYLCQNNLGETVVSGTVTVQVPTAKVRFRRTEAPEVRFKYNDRYSELINSCSGLPPLKTAIVHPVKAYGITAIDEAVKANLIDPVLVGPAKRIYEAAVEAEVDIDQYELIDTEHSHAAAEEAVRLAATKQVEALMKGALHTEELLSAMLPADAGLRTERRISHAFVMDIPTYHKPLIITDAAININPDLETKADICCNAVDLWRSTAGDETAPKVAVLAAVETVSQQMQATLDAASLCKMAQRGQIDCGILDGPLALDLAISPQAVEKKGIVSQVAGDADILLVPNIEAGNMVAKQLTFLGNSDAAGLVLGARVPVILVSRSDNLRTRLMSCALAVRVAHARREGKIK